MAPNGTPNGAQHNIDRFTLLALAENVLEQTKTITKYFQANDLAAPSFSLNSSATPTSEEYAALQTNLKTCIEDLQRLVDGPRKFWRFFFIQGYNLAAVQIALDFEFFTHIPAEGAISIEELARKAGLDLDRTARVVRILITYRIFAEHTAGFISHSSTSIVLQQDEELRCTAHYSLDEMLKAAADSNECLKALPYESDGTHCPFATRHGVPIFEYYKKKPDKAGRFARAMAGATRVGRHINELRDCFPWGNLQGTVVDIGGGSGHISMALARLFPHLSFVIQDLGSGMLDEGQKLLTDDVRDRVSFVQQSFFEPQPYRGAAAFLLRQCTHNWADKDVVNMFKAVVPGLEGSNPSTPLLVNDIVMPEPNTWARLDEREVREIDMIMMISFGAKQRTLAEFKVLLAEADLRYEVSKVHATGPLGLLEIYLRR